MIDKEKFIRIVHEQFEELEDEVFTLETEFKNNEEWDSLTALSIIAVLDTEFNIQINSEELEKVFKIEELYNLALKHQK